MRIYTVVLEDNGKVQDAAAEHGAQGNGEHNLRYNADGLARAVDDVIDDAAEVTGNHAQRRADDAGDDNCQQTHNQRHAAARNHAGKQVAAVFIRAQPVGGAHALIAFGNRNLVRVIGHQEIRKDGNEDNQQNDDGADQHNFAGE